MGAAAATPDTVALSIDSEPLAELGDPVPKKLALVDAQQLVPVADEGLAQDGPLDLIVDGFPSGSRYTDVAHRVPSYGPGLGVLPYTAEAISLSDSCILSRLVAEIKTKFTIYWETYKTIL